MSQNIQYKSLRDIAFKQLHMAFVDAFSNYQVPMTLTESQLKYMLQRRAYSPGDSFGAFQNKKLIGFVFNGKGEWQNVPTAYDTGTGIIQEYQGKGIAGKLFDFTIENLRKRGFQSYLLEVLKDNEGAIRMYRNRQFEISRIFDFYVFDKAKILRNSAYNLDSFSYESAPTCTADLNASLWDFEPSWQNNNASIHRKIANFTTLKVMKDKFLVGYGIIERHTGDIPQLAVHPDFRRMGIATSLLQDLAPFSASSKIRLINIPADHQAFKHLFKKMNIAAGQGQYEMKLNL